MAEFDELASVTDGSQLNQGYFNGIYNTLTKTIEAVYGDSIINGLIVAEQSTPDQTAQVQSGNCLISGVNIVSAGDLSVSFTNADATNPRYDLVSVDDNGDINVTDGTAAATPTIPNLPSSSAAIAYVYRAANDNVINAADITDCRSIVGELYSAENNTQETHNTATWTVAKTITIPAYRLKKYFTVRFDVDGLWEAYDGNTSDGTYDFASARISVNGAVQETITAEYQFEAQGTSPYGVSSLVTKPDIKMYFSEDDFDFNQIITIELELYAFQNIDGDTSDDALAINHSVYVEGK